MSSMTRSRRAVLRRREILLGAALVAGCKHAATPERPPPDYVSHPEAYQVSDPAVPPCRFREGDAITVERHGAVYRFVAQSPERTITVKTASGPAAGSGTGDVQVTIGDTTSVAVEVEMGTSTERCSRTVERVTIPWSSIADGAKVTVPIATTNVQCHVSGPVVTVERVLASGNPTLRVRPTSPRVLVAVAGASFSDVVDVQSRPGSGISMTIVVQPVADGGASCQSHQETLSIQDADLPALGAPPKPFALPR